MKPLRILVACEESQAATIELRKRGHEAFSCDVQESSGGHPEWHIQGDVLEQLNKGWDMMIAFPPCTYLTYAGIGHWGNPGRFLLRANAILFVAELWESEIQKICIENPQGCLSTALRKPDQTIEPYHFGDSAKKRTNLWLKGLQPLIHRKADDLFGLQTAVDKPDPTYIEANGKKRYYTDAISGFDPTKRALLRSKTFPGIARAMAVQWTLDLSAL